ncbi:MAG: hypothetical protein LIR46_03030 [Bacteroidota bacterium]|nr:hypothetical protein [Bacteroidota bacterium]
MKKSFWKIFAKTQLKTRKPLKNKGTSQLRFLKQNVKKLRFFAADDPFLPIFTKRPYPKTRL